jgi:hypothetical protein
MLARFTNIHGDQNTGLLLETDPGGLALIFWDDFNALRERLKATRRYREKIDEKSLRPHIGWVRPAEAGAAKGTRLEPLPAHVRFTVPELQALAQAALAGKLAEIWQARQGEIMAVYAKSIHDEG